MPLAFLGGEKKRRKKHSRTEPAPQNADAFAQPEAQNGNLYLTPSPPDPYYTYPAQPDYYTYSAQPYGGPYLQPSPPQAYYPPAAAPYDNAYLQPSPPNAQSQPRPQYRHSYNNLRDQLTSLPGKSMTRLTTKTSQCFERSTDGLTQALNQGAALCDRSTELITNTYGQGAALCDLMGSKLDAVITSIDGERFSGQEQDLMVDSSFDTYPSTSDPLVETSRAAPRAKKAYSSSSSSKDSNHFSKVWLYANSRLPPHLPPFKIYMPTWPLLCLAANYSEHVYTPPKSKDSEVESHVPSDWRSGTKAMVLKSIPIDDMHTVVFAIRGSATFMDWAVNYRSAPSSPAGFLDDEGNLCHAGFLHVARKMITPVAERLRALLEQNPSRSHCSLLITGHSAGGAVAALLYSHMMSTTVQSDLSYLTSFFKRVHCITFGAPPVSLLPLQRPSDKRHRKSMFYNFINEGDPVPRADKQVVRSLLKLYASPAPTSLYSSTLNSLSKLNISSNPSRVTLQTMSSKPSKGLKFSKSSNGSTATVGTLPTWTVPPTTLSVAGRLVVLREKLGRQGTEDVEAVTVDDELLRTVVYGDPLKHMMTLYKQRIEQLAVRAATAGGY